MYKSLNGKYNTTNSLNNKFDIHYSLNKEKTTKYIDKKKRV